MRNDSFQVWSSRTPTFISLSGIANTLSKPSTFIDCLDALDYHIRLMRDWIRARLDTYEGRHQRREEEFAGLVSRHVNALSNRRTLKTYILILTGVNALIWLSVIVFPRDVADGWTKATSVNDRLGATVIAIIFGIGTSLSYSVFRLKYPDLEDPKFEDEIFASQKYSDHSLKRWRIWLFSVIGGVLNVLLLVLTELYLFLGW